MPRRNFVLPGIGAYKPKLKGSPEFEMAKTILRRANMVVFDAYVTDGARGRGYVYVDKQLKTPADVIEMARKITRGGRNA